MKKVALITGSGKQRLGWHVAQAAAECGYRLAIHYFRSAQDAEASVAAFEGRGVEAAAFQADLTDEQAVGRLVGGVLERFGQIDMLVNTAAIWQPKRLEDVTAADVRAHLETNTLATFLCCQHAGLAMVRQPEGGAIVNLGDWATARPYLDYAPYFTSKGAVIALTRSLAVELGTRNPKVRVNCILPGPALLPADTTEAERALLANSTLARRVDCPDELAAAVVHLAENEFITGVCLPVDGGRTIYAGDEKP